MSPSTDTADQPTLWEHAPSADSELPAGPRAARDQFLARLLAADADVTSSSEEMVAARLYLKRLKSWNRRALDGRRRLWSEIMQFLELFPAREPSSTGQDEGAAASATPALAVRGIHELRVNQQQELALRLEAARLLESGVSPSQVLALLPSSRSRAWVYRIKIRVSQGDRELKDGRGANERPRRFAGDVCARVENIYMNPLAKGPISQVVRSLRERQRTLNEPVPSESWVRRQIKQKVQYQLLRDLGSEGHRRHARPLVVTKDAHVRPGEIYEIDSTGLDVWVRIRRPDGEWQPVRPSLTVILDVGSRSIVGTHLTIGAANDTSVRCAWLKAISIKDRGMNWPMCGLPNVLRLDRGSEYTQQFLTALTAAGVEIDQCPPNYPDARAKGERFFRTLNSLIHSLEGSTSALGVGEEAVLPVLGALLTPDLLTDAITSFITRDYHQENHSALGRSPAEMWRLQVNTREALPEHVLSVLPGHTEATVRRGTVAVQKANKRVVFMAKGLGAHEEQCVTVRWMDLTTSVFLFATDTGRYLGEAVSPLHPDAEEIAGEIRGERLATSLAFQEMTKTIRNRARVDWSTTPTVQAQIQERVDELRDARAVETERVPDAMDAVQSALKGRYE